MFIADKLLIEKAQITLMATAGDEACAISFPLAAPYLSLRLAVFRGPEGAQMAAKAREERRLVFQDRTYRPVADLSAPLGRADVLLVEPA